MWTDVFSNSTGEDQAVPRASGSSKERKEGLGLNTGKDWSLESAGFALGSPGGVPGLVAQFSSRPAQHRSPLPCKTLQMEVP